MKSLGHHPVAKIFEQAERKGSCGKNHAFSGKKRNAKIIR